MAALIALPDHQRRPIVMALCNQMSYRQVASDLGLPEEKVKAQMRFGLERIRTDLGPLFP